MTKRAFGLLFAIAWVAGAGILISAQTPSSSPGIVGEWAWGVSAGVVEIRADGTGKDGRGNSMKWSLRDSASRSYTLSWSHGYTDTAVLSADGNSLVVQNNVGTRFTATRRGGGAGARPMDLNGSWSRGLVHIWQDGTDILMTAAWKRSDGRYVSLRGEGRLNGNVVDVRIRYSPMSHGPQPEWQGRLTVSDDGQVLNAVYSTAAGQKDVQVYQRDR
jgi:hypothetical protein